MKLSTVVLILACLLLSLVIASSGRRGRKTGRIKNSSGDKSGSRDKSSSGGKSNSGGKSSSRDKSSSGGKSNSGSKSSSGGKSTSGGKTSSEGKSNSGSKSSSEGKSRSRGKSSSKWKAPTKAPTTEQTTVPITSPTTKGPTTPSQGGLPPPRDCWDLQQKHKVSKDGVYQVYPAEGVKKSVLCDMTTDGGGWTIFQQRYIGFVKFNRNYTEYANGFGDLQIEFWMGNYFIHQFTTIENQTLRVDLCKADGSSKYAIYDTFAIGSGAECYKLHVADYLGTAGDGLIGSVEDPQHDGQCFSAYDKDEDNMIEFNCAVTYDSGWWFNGCYNALLNGNYHSYGIYWLKVIYKGSQMKFRPSHARKHDPTSRNFRCPVK